MIKAGFAGVLIFATCTVHAAQTHEFDYTSTLSGTETFFTGPYPGAPNSITTENVTGTYTIDLMVSGHGPSMTLVGYDINLALNNGTSVNDITAGQLVNSPWQLSTGLNTCTTPSNSTINGCVNISENHRGDFQSAMVNYTMSSQWSQIIGTSNSVNYSNVYCGPGLQDDALAVVHGSICALSVSKTSGGNWSSAQPTRAPEIGNDAGAMTLAAVLAALALGRRRISA